MSPRLSRSPQHVFICHNKADKNFARSLAVALADQGVGVWFDERKLQPGDSITAGIERGIIDADTFILIWSCWAAQSRWVDGEWRAAFNQRMSAGTLRLIPVILDETPLPPLLTDHLGIKVLAGPDVVSVAAKIVGKVEPKELARRLQERFFEMLEHIGEGAHLSHYRLCPRCGSTQLVGFEQMDNRETRYFCIRCKDCGWRDGDEI